MFPPIDLPAPVSVTASPFSPSSALPPRWLFLTNQPLRIPSQITRPKTSSRTTTGIVTARARIFVETPPPPPPLLLLSLAELPAVALVGSEVAALEADPVEVVVAVVGVVPDVWSRLSPASLESNPSSRQQKTQNRNFPP